MQRWVWGPLAVAPLTEFGTLTLVRAFVTRSLLSQVKPVVTVGLLLPLLLPCEGFVLSPPDLGHGSFPSSP